MLERLDNRQRRVVRVLVEMLAPYKGRVYDLCCGFDFPLTCLEKSEGVILYVKRLLSVNPRFNLI